eukprot:8757566-Karenia_brevis.AAC.1
MALMSKAQPTKRQGSSYQTTCEYQAPVSSDQGVRDTLFNIMGSTAYDEKAAIHNRKRKVGNEYSAVEEAS